MKRFILFLLLLSLTVYIHSDDFDSNVPAFWEVISSNDAIDYFEVRILDAEGNEYSSSNPIGLAVDHVKVNAGATVYLKWSIVTAKPVKLYMKPSGALLSATDSIGWSVSCNGKTSGSENEYSEILLYSHLPSVSCVSKKSGMEMNFLTESVEGKGTGSDYKASIKLELRTN